MLNFFKEPKKEHPVEKAVKEKIAEAMPEAINAYDVANENIDDKFDGVKKNAEVTREAKVKAAIDAEEETVGNALTVASNEKEAALNAAVDKIFCN